MVHNDQTIIIRNRRDHNQYVIHNRIVDEWLPIIGLQGMRQGFCLDRCTILETRLLQTPEKVFVEAEITEFFVC